MDFDHPIAIVQCLLPPVGQRLLALRTASTREDGVRGWEAKREQQRCQLAAASRPATALTAGPAPISAVSSSSAAGTLACPTSNAGVHGRVGYTGGRDRGSVPNSG
jgi:hypothetical protein